MFLNQNAGTFNVQVHKKKLDEKLWIVIKNRESICDLKNWFKLNREVPSKDSHLYFTLKGSSEAHFPQVDMFIRDLMKSL